MAMTEICSICKDAERPTMHKCISFGSPAHNVFCSTLLPDDTRMCNLCSGSKKRLAKTSDNNDKQNAPEKKTKLLQQSKLGFFIKKHQDEEAIKDINEDNDSNMSANSKETKENEQSTFANEDDSNSTRSLIETCNTTSSTIGYPSGASADSQKIESLDYSISTKFSSNFYYFKLGGGIKGRSYVCCDTCYNQQATIKTFRKSKIKIKIKNLIRLIVVLSRQITR